MTVTTPTLSNFQYYYNGLTFGSGTDIQIVNEAGLRTLPETRSQDVNRPRQDGAFAGLNYLAERVVTLTLSVTVTKEQPFEDVVADMVNAFRPISDPTQQKELWFNYPGWAAPRYVRGRVTRVGFPVDVDYSFHRIASLNVEIVCADTNIYDPSTTATLRSGGTSTIHNIQVDGNATDYPSFVVNGPCSNFAFYRQHPLLPDIFWFLGFDLTLTASDTFRVDMRTGQALLNGQADGIMRYLQPGSQWWGLDANDPGTDSWDVKFLAGGMTSATSVTVTYSNAWAWS